MIEESLWSLPWAGVPPGSVPLQVSQGQRPDEQLKRAEPALQNLITDCWAQDANVRPDFQRVVGRLEQMVRDRRPSVTEDVEAGGGGSDEGRGGQRGRD